LNSTVDGKNLTGSFPEETCLLRDLQEVLLPNNMLQGKLPFCLSRLSGLEDLNLESNHLSGSFPYQVLIVPSLKSLTLSNNMFEGYLDDFLFQYPAMSSLKELQLDNNFFHGRIPGEFIKFQELEKLSLQGNGLIGDVTTLCGMNLTSFSVDCTAVTCSCCNDCDLFLGG
jgi:hypothetical protein